MTDKIKDLEYQLNLKENEIDQLKDYEVSIKQKF